MRTRDRNATF